MDGSVSSGKDFHYVSSHAVQTCQNKENKNHPELTMSELLRMHFNLSKHIFYKKHFIKKKQVYLGAVNCFCIDKIIIHRTIKHILQHRNSIMFIYFACEQQNSIPGRKKKYMYIYKTCLLKKKDILTTLGLKCYFLKILFLVVLV